MVIVSDHTKGLYQDRWSEDGVLHYTGMGAVGDQSLSHQNRTLAETRNSGVVAHLFEVFTPKEYVYAGEVELAGKPYTETQPDANGADGTVWMFPVRLVGGAVPEPRPDEIWALEKEREDSLEGQSLEQLRKLADKAPKQPERRQSVASQEVRNPVVSAYVKKAADGYCDLCDQEAPFNTQRGKPYLEFHHIEWLARGGVDTISNAVALCPNYHRRMHVRDLKADREKLRRRVERRDS